VQAPVLEFALRLLRLWRLLRLGPMIRRLFTVQGVRYVALLEVITMLAGGQGYAAVEDKSIVDGLYWSFGTMTTVGFGKEPNTDVAKLLGVALVLIGVGFVAILTGSIAQRFIEPAIVEIEEAEEETRADRGGPTRASARDFLAPGSFGDGARRATQAPRLGASRYPPTRWKRLGSDRLQQRAAVCRRSRRHRPICAGLEIDGGQPQRSARS
jgi:hypothetical protein